MTFYVGRFAPSPTGPLHLGSLLAAVASFLDARANNGKWLLRIEDVDSLRTVPESTQQIIHTLESHGLFWDGEVQFQTTNNAAYQAALAQLQAMQRVFYCDCTRASLSGAGPYPGRCRRNKTATYTLATRHQPASHAIRFECGKTTVEFNDRILGKQSFQLQPLGDFIVRRRDSLFAYQLAVVIDDADQGVSNVVRGADLLASSPWQIELQQALGLPQPLYAHLPLLLHAKSNDKLSKQTGAVAIDNRTAISNLIKVLTLLGQELPDLANHLLPTELLNFATIRWNIDKIPKTAIIVK